MDGTVSILGVPFSKLTLHETTLHLTKHIQSGESKLFHLITANPEITITSQSDESSMNHTSRSGFNHS